MVNLNFNLSILHPSKLKKINSKMNSTSFNINNFFCFRSFVIAVITISIIFLNYLNLSVVGDVASSFRFEQYFEFIATKSSNQTSKGLHQTRPLRQRSEIVEDLCGKSNSNLSKSYSQLSQVFDPTQQTVHFELTPAVRARARGGHPFPELTATDAPCISIILAFENELAAAVLETLESLSAQTYVDFELLIVLSSPPEYELRTLEAKDLRIKILDLTAEDKGDLALPKLNGQPWTIRNLAGNHARGRYLMYLNAGDMLEPTALEKFHFYLKVHSEWAWVSSFRVMMSQDSPNAPHLRKQGFQTFDAHLHVFNGGEVFLIRKEMHVKTGGFKEGPPLRGGAFSFWEYALNLASLGHWGFSIPEYLIWCYQDTFQPYNHISSASSWLKKMYPDLWKTNGFPSVESWDIIKQPVYTYMPLTKIPLAASVRDIETQRWEKRSYSVMFILEDMFQDDGELSMNLLVLEEISTSLRWDVTVVVTDLHDKRRKGEGLWLEGVHRDLCENQNILQFFTSDFFCLNTFLHPEDYPLFISQVLKSRQTDLVFISGKFGYQMLPWLRKGHPEPLFVDFLHEKETIKGRSAAVNSLHLNSFLDFTFVASNDMKTWLVNLGMPVQKITVLQLVSNVILCEMEKSIKPRIHQVLSEQYKIESSDNLVIIFAEDFAGTLKIQFLKTLVSHFMKSLAKEYKKQANLPVPRWKSKRTAKEQNWKVVVLGDDPSLQQYLKLSKDIDDSLFVFIKDFSHVLLTELIQRSTSILIPPSWDQRPITSCAGIAMPILLSIAMSFSIPILHASSTYISGANLMDKEYFFRIDEDQKGGPNSHVPFAHLYSEKLLWISKNLNKSVSRARQAKSLSCAKRGNKRNKDHNLKEAICSNRLISQKEDKAVLNEDEIIQNMLNWQVFPIVENLRLDHEVQSIYYNT